MQQPERSPQKDALQWIRRARSNLARAKAPAPVDALPEDAAYDAQQAAEKAIKAVLICRSIPFRFVHDLGELLETARKHGVDIPVVVGQMVELTEYAVETRYPGPYEPLTEADISHAVQIAEAVVRWAEAVVRPD